MSWILERMPGESPRVPRTAEREAGEAFALLMAALMDGGLSRPLADAIVRHCETWSRPIPKPKD